MGRDAVLRKIQSLDLPVGQYVIVGSAVLAVLGIRNVNDIDVLAVPELFKKLNEQSDWLKKEGVKIWADFCVGAFQPSFAFLFESAIVINRIPFINLHNLVRAKKELAKSKSIMDVFLIKCYKQKQNKYY